MSSNCTIWHVLNFSNLTTTGSFFSWADLDKCVAVVDFDGACHFFRISCEGQAIACSVESQSQQPIWVGRGGPHSAQLYRMPATCHVEEPNKSVSGPLHARRDLLEPKSRLRALCKSVGGFWDQNCDTARHAGHMHIF